MKHWQLLNIEDRRDVLEITSANRNLPQAAVEKDWWVTMVLKTLSTTRYFICFNVFKISKNLKNRYVEKPR